MLLPILAFAIFSGLTGCKKDTAAKTTSAHYFSATSSTVGTFSVAGSETGAAGATGAKVDIWGEDASGRNITLHLNPYTGATGVITMSGETGALYQNGSTRITSTTGTITLTSISPDLAGSFSYTGTDGIIYSGTFNVAAP